MGEALSTVLGPFYLVLGLSILLYAGSWKKIMKYWEKDHLALFPLMTVILLFGLLFVSILNVSGEYTWEMNKWLITTIIASVWIIKGAAYFLLPGSVIKWKLKLAQNTAILYIGGVAAVAMGGFLTYYTYFV